jgi:SOS response regulatory protein OraA/RecX
MDTETIATENQDQKDNLIKLLSAGYKVEEIKEIMGENSNFLDNTELVDEYVESKKGKKK